MENRIRPQDRSRQAILDRLESWHVDADDLPTVDTARLTRFDDPIAKFSEMLAMVGGEVHLVADTKEIEAILQQIDVFATAKRIASVVPGIPGNVDVTAIEDPHSLESLDWMIARGEFVVAENGAIWIEGESLPHRVMLFIAQYSAIVVSRANVVHHMHEAYARIGSPQPGFGVFVSGPSKTADIEQSLVLGAHGCRKLQVFLTE